MHSTFVVDEPEADGREVWSLPAQKRRIDSLESEYALDRGRSGPVGAPLIEGGTTRTRAGSILVDWIDYTRSIDGEDYRRDSR